VISVYIFKSKKLLRLSLNYLSFAHLKNSTHMVGDVSRQPNTSV